MDGSQKNDTKKVRLAVFELDYLDYGQVCAFVESMGETATVYDRGIKVIPSPASNLSEPLPLDYFVLHYRGTMVDASNKLRVVGRQIWTRDDEGLVEGRLRSRTIEYHMGHVNTTPESNTRSEPFDINDSWEVHYRGRRE